MCDVLSEIQSVAKCHCFQVILRIGPWCRYSDLFAKILSTEVPLMLASTKFVSQLRPSDLRSQCFSAPQLFLTFLYLKSLVIAKQRKSLVPLSFSAPIVLCEDHFGPPKPLETPSCQAVMAYTSSL